MKRFWFVLAAAVAASGCSNSGTTPPVSSPKPPGNGASGYRLVSSFPKGGTLAQIPEGNMVVVQGRLYGIAHGGNNFNGAIWSATANERPTTVYRFGSTAQDGVDPNKDLIEIGGTIYGTTAHGGKYGHGTVFKFVPNLNPVLDTEKAVYNFTGGTDGGTPAAGLFSLTVTPGGDMLFGTTTQGGTHGKGGVFKLSGSGLGTIDVLHQFIGAPDAAQVEAPLTMAYGVLWGVSTEGGLHAGSGGSFPNGFGTIFWVDPVSGKSGIFYDCDGDTMLAPREALVYDGKHTLYSVASGFNQRDGYIYGVLTHDFPNGTPAILHAFDKSEGSSPSGALLLDGNYLYGTANVGPNDRAGGIFYAWNVASPAFVSLHTFTGVGREPSDDGGNPASTPILYNHGIYGTTRGGGAEGFGSVWAYFAQ